MQTDASIFKMVFAALGAKRLRAQLMLKIIEVPGITPPELQKAFTIGREGESTVRYDLKLLESARLVRSEYARGSHRNLVTRKYYWNETEFPSDKFITVLRLLTVEEPS